MGVGTIPKLEGLKGPSPAAAAAAAPAAAAVAPADLRMAESGFHVDLSGFKILRTAVLVTGGMASKLFGLGMMGFMVFQSFKQSQPQPQQSLDQRRGPKA